MPDAAPVQPAELERQRAFLQRLARQLVRGEAAAEDLVQETFVRALERPPASATALRAWLASVARRLALNRARGEQRMLARERRVAHPETVAPHDEALASLELQERLIAAVKALDEPYRTTLWLRFHEGLAPGAIAECQGTTKKTVESRLTRGLAQLRSELDRRSGGDRTQWLGGLVLLSRTAPGSLQVGRILSGTVGGIAMKKLLAACVLVLLLGVLWRLVPREPAARAIGSDTVVALEGARPGAVATAPETPRRVALEPEPERADAAPRGALRIRVRWDDGAPASDVGLFVLPEDDPLGKRNALRARTDGAGLALVESIHSGAVRIEADRGGEILVEAVEGLEVEVTLELPAGIDVEGTVTDATGAPVAGAEILLVSSRRDWLATRVVGASAADGSYRIRAAGADLAVSARAERYVPAFLRPLSEEHERHVRADLVLDWVDFALRGVVRDPEHRPLAGALVAVGLSRGQGYSLAGEPARRRFGMPVVSSEVDGRFEASGVEHAGMPVAVMAEGYPIQIAEFPGWSRSVTYGEIVLDAPASIAGIVRDPDGAPVAGALVEVTAIRDRPAQEVPFPLPRARSDERGRFRLELVAPGTVPVQAEPPAGRALGHAFASVSTAPGAEASLELRLLAADVIRGRARDAQDAPLAGADVTCTAQGGSRQRATTDADGRFEFERCSTPPYRVELIEPGGYKALAKLTGVVPGLEEIVLTAPETGTVTGTFVDEGKLVPAPPDTPEPTDVVSLRMSSRLGTPGKPSAYLSSADGSWGSVRWSEEAFTFENVPAGKYRLNMRTGEDPRYPAWTHRSEWFELRGGETIDLGVIRTPATGEDPAGSLVLEVSPPGLAGLSTVLRSPDHDVVAFIREEGGALRAGALAPGRYFVSVRADGMGDACAPVEIRAGEEEEVRVQLEPGTARTLSFPTADPAATWSALKVSIRGSDGQLLGVTRLPVPLDTSHGVLVHAPVGRFTVEAETDTGLVARGTFTVLALAEQDSVLAFELR